MNYSIFRSEQIMTIPDLAQVGSHNAREKQAYKSNPDIDISKTKNNIEIIPTNTKYVKKFYEITKEYRLEHDERMKSERSERRKTFNQMLNSSQNVVADDLLFTMTDSKFFNNLERKDLIKFGNVCKDFVKEDLGYKDEQIIQMVMHLDEKTPHVHCTVVPLIKKFDRRTNSERYTISKKQYIHDKLHLSQLQDRFHERLLEAGFDVDRGIKGNDREHLNIKELKKVTNYYNKQLDVKSDKLNNAISNLNDDIKSKKEILFDKEHVKISNKTFDDIKEVIKESERVIEMQPKIEKVFDEVKSYTRSYDSLERENNNLKAKNERLIEDNKSLINTINSLLSKLAELFKKILHIGSNQDKDNVESNIKNMFDNKLYGKYEVEDICKGTTKEIPLKQHVGLLPKNFHKYVTKINKDAENEIEEFQEKLHKNKDDYSL